MMFLPVGISLLNGTIDLQYLEMKENGLTPYAFKMNDSCNETENSNTFNLICTIFNQFKLIT